MRKRNHRIVFYLNDDELSAFEEKVKRTALSREGFIRSMLSDVEIIERPPADVPLLLREIKRVGNNINQILALANAKGFLDAPRLKIVVDELREVDRLIFETYTKGG